MKAFKFILVILSVFLFGYLQNNAQSVISRQSKAKTTTTEKKTVSSQKNVSKKSKKLGSNSQTNKNKSNEQPITISAPDDYINGHGYVDLGLPSGTKWATCNIGATLPEDNGNYYAYGDTSIKSIYDVSTCITNDVGGVQKEDEAITEKICNGENLKPSYDAASVNWGASWRMPTSEEITELCKKSTWTWVTYKGKKGYKGVGPNGKSIFLPAAGYKFITSLEADNRIGNYRSSTFQGKYDTFKLFFDNWEPRDIPRDIKWGSRVSGYSVRPVHS